MFPSCLPVMYPPSSPRNVPVRGKVALVLGFYGSEGSKPTPLGPVRRHYGQTERENQNQRRLGPYGGITGRRRRRSKGTLLSSPRIVFPFCLPVNFPLSSLCTVFPSRLSVPFSPLVSPYRFPLSSPRKFSVRGKVALVLWF